ncbi:uncharacterized protein METZ01_LOCUS464904 [marine metagenome]|uniref:Uncharacterized protein n=1 Tax=marine metagenome TaxID=408172 RepID=A0A383AWY5_9ZZZZ
MIYTINITSKINDYKFIVKIHKNSL